MKKIISFLLFLAVNMIGYSFGLIISPLKYEYTVEAGKSVDGKITITNNETGAFTLYSSKEDFIAGDDKGNPKFIKPQEQTSTSNSLVNWLTIEDEHVTLAPGESREVQFRINVPANGEPGGHYGAVFFSQGAGTGQVALVSRLGVLLILNVPGEVKIGGEVKYVKLGTAEGTGLKESSDFQNFPIYFESNFQNQGNVHLKPKGQIIILDEKGEQLKKIGKEALSTPAGAYIGEQLVDYIPINDANGNVLPNSERTFQSVWSGFGYQIVNEDGTRGVQYKSLQEYYNEKGAEDKKYLKFWETIKDTPVRKKFTAQVNISYEGKDGVKKDFNATKDFYLSYNESVVGINFFVVGGGAVVILLLLYYIFIGKKNSEAKLRERIMQEMNKNK